MTDAVGRHDRGGEASVGHLRLRERRLSGIPSRFQTHSATADLGLNHYQKKGAPLDRKMERQSVCKWVCVSGSEGERKARVGEAHKRRQWPNSERDGPELE